jgi:predicted RNA-binding Zn ribbon-like protein
VQALVNSYDALTDRETLASPADLERWMNRHGIEPGPRPPRPRDVAYLLRVREAIRGVLAAHNGAPRDPGALSFLQEVAGRACLRPRFDEEGRPALESSGAGLDGVLSAVFRSAVDGGDAGRWERLRACPECGWVFYDHSRNRSGSWCTMAICGSRAKMRAYRQRRSGGAAPTLAGS